VRKIPQIPPRRISATAPTPTSSTEAGSISDFTGLPGPKQADGGKDVSMEYRYEEANMWTTPQIPTRQIPASAPTTLAGASSINSVTGLPRLKQDDDGKDVSMEDLYEDCRPSNTWPTPQIPPQQIPASTPTTHAEASSINSITGLPRPKQADDGKYLYMEDLYDDCRPHKMWTTPQTRTCRIPASTATIPKEVHSVSGYTGPTQVEKAKLEDKSINLQFCLVTSTKKEIPSINPNIPGYEMEEHSKITWNSLPKFRYIFSLAMFSESEYALLTSKSKNPRIWQTP
jgi:hypothetical protein